MVEPGGRIEVRGRREAPVVMTCGAPVGQRAPGCWGGLAVRGTAAAHDSSGELRYLRVEFAGGASVPGAASAALALDGVGGGTVVDHVQVHASLGDGLAFRGGTVGCSWCVASEARRDSVVWSGGWQGAAQYLYVRQGARAASALRGIAPASAARLRGPVFANLTLIGGYDIGTIGGAPGTRRTIGPGLVLEGQASVTVWNMLAKGFGGFAVDAPPTSFADGRSRIAGAVLSHSGYRHGGPSQIRGGLEPWVKYVRPDRGLTGVPQGPGADPLVVRQEPDPGLINDRHEANPDPRPRSGAAVLRLGTPAVPPFDSRFAREADYVGAFGGRNWLEEWTFFGPERDYAPPEQDLSRQGREGPPPEAAILPEGPGPAGEQGGIRP